MRRISIGRRVRGWDPPTVVAKAATVAVILGVIVAIMSC